MTPPDTAPSDSDAKLDTDAQAAALLQIRNLPRHIICVGSQRSGTTWLYNNLIQSPDVAQPKLKEIDYFRDLGNYVNGPRWYLEQLQHAPGLATVDITPEYAIDRTALERIRAQAPNALVIFIIRDPVDRLRSAYQKLVFDGFSNLSPWRFVKYNYDQAIDRSRYLDCAIYLSDSFCNVLVLDYADIDEFPEEVWQKVCAFAGIAPFSPNTARQNASKRNGLATRLFGELSRTLESSAGGRRLKAHLVHQPWVMRIYQALIQTSKKKEFSQQDLEKLNRLFGDDYAETKARYAQRFANQ